MRFAVLVPVVLVVIAGTTLLGGTRIGWTDVFTPAGLDEPGSPAYVFWMLRMPRTLLAACVGAGLALGGVIFQALFRNPLAEPFTLGIASGASLAAAAGFLAGWRGAGPAGLPWLVVYAFIGALAAMALVYAVSRVHRARNMARLLLAGVCVAYLCSAGILLVFYFADRAITNEVVHWMMGSLFTVRWGAPAAVAVVLVPVLVLATASHRALDLLTFGDELAASRGVAVGWTVWSCYVLVGLLTAVIVAHCGPIGFVGLMVPHMGRAIFGGRTLPLVFGAALLGAGFLAVCDGLARAVPVTELPVGVVTNILGAAFFFYLLATREVARET